MSAVGISVQWCIEVDKLKFDDGVVDGLVVREWVHLDICAMMVSVGRGVCQELSCLPCSTEAAAMNHNVEVQPLGQDMIEGHVVDPKHMSHVPFGG